MVIPLSSVVILPEWHCAASCAFFFFCTSPRRFFLDAGEAFFLSIQSCVYSCTTLFQTFSWLCKGGLCSDSHQIIRTPVLCLLYHGHLRFVENKM